MIKKIIVRVNNSFKFRANKINREITALKSKQHARYTIKKYPHRPVGSDQDLFRNYLKSAYGPISGYSRSKINVLIVVHNTGQPTSSVFIRLISPLTRPSVAKYIGIEFIDARNLVIPSGTDVCIVARTAISDIEQAKRFQKELKQKNIKLIVDTDDAFVYLDRNHPQYNLQKSNHGALNYLIEKADELWVSTDELKEEYKNMRNVAVIRNTLDDRLWTRINTQPKNETGIKNILYMGTVTHDNDFSIVFPALCKLQAKYPGKFTLTIIGVSDSIPKSDWINIIAAPHPIYPEFVKWFNNLPAFDVGIAPLENSKFNESKSDIKCLDYLACGIYPVVSDVKAYQNNELDGMITRVKNTEEAWFAALENIVFSKQNESFEKAVAYLKHKRNVDKTAKELHYRMKNLIKKG